MTLSANKQITAVVAAVFCAFVTLGTSIAPGVAPYVA